MKKLVIVILALLFAYNLFAATSNANWIFVTKGRVYSSPIVYKNLVLVGSGDSTFYAVDKILGKEVWSYKTKGAIHSSPCVYEGIVLFGSTDGNLYALNAENGALIWAFSSNGEKMLDIWDYYLSSPSVSNGVVYWGSGDEHIYAIDGTSGTLLWKFKAEGIIHASPTIYEGRVFIGDYGGYFFALNAENGEMIWKFCTVGDTYFPNGEVQKGAAISDGIVYFGSRDFNIYAIDAKTGRGHWNMKEQGSWVIATPLVYSKNIYFGTSDTHRFYCVNKANGNIKWMLPLPMRVYGSAVQQKGIIYFGCFDGKLYGVCAETGEIKWTYQTKGSKAHYANVYNEKGSFKEGFEIYGKDYVEAERTIHSLGSILSTPIVDGDTMYFGSSDGGLYSVKIN